MPDNFNTAYLLSSKERQQPQMDAMLAELDAMSQGPQQVPPSVPVAQAPMPASLAQPVPKKEPSPGIINETLKAVGGGMAEGARQAWNTIDDAATWLDNHFLDLRINSQTFGQVGGATASGGEAHKEALQIPDLPEWAQNKTAAGQVGRSLVQFAVPFLGATKALKMAGVANGVVRGGAAGMATDFAGFDPHEKRLSNLILEMTDGNPALGKPVFDYLAADPSDTNMEGRLKNTLEGLGIGIAAEGVLKGFKAVKAYANSKGKNAAQMLQEASKETPAAATKGSEKAPVGEALDERIVKAQARVEALEGAGKDPSAAQKLLDSLLRKKDDGLYEAGSKLTKEQAGKLDSAGEVDNIAPAIANEKKPPVIPEDKVGSLVQAAREGGMEKLAQAVKKSDFNFTHIDTDDEVKSTIDAFSAVFEKEADLAKHGTQSFAEMKELAEELGADADTLKGLYQDTGNLGGRILAHRALMAASAEHVAKLAKVAATGDTQGILDLRKQVALHAAIQAKMKGVQTEVARALSQFRINSTGVDLGFDERDTLIEAMGGYAVNIKFARQLAEISDPKKLNALTRKGALARTQDALFEVWVNGLLSGPQTHVVNAMGNALVAIGSSAERYGASLIGKVLRTGPDAVQAGEAKAHLFGMMEGIKDALSITREGLDAVVRAGGEALTGDLQAARNTLMESSGEFGSVYRSFASDAPILDNAAYATKEMDLQAAAISAEAFGLDQAGMMGRLADGLGALIRTPGRLLTASDELFKTIHYRGELKAQAYRTAVAEGRSGEALFQRIAELVEDPTPELSAQALQAARVGTFTSPLGRGGAAFQQAVSHTPGARYIVPFMRTPINIMKYVGERTPGLNLLSANVRQEFLAGGARRDMVLAKTTLGGSLYALGAYLSAQGLITGGGEKNQAAERLGGWQPYSIKVGDTYYAYNRMDPVGMFLGLAADVADLSGSVGKEEMEGVASAAVLALSRNLVSKSYASGLVNLIEAIANPDTKGESYIRNFAASWVPSAVNAVRKEEDPLMREVWSLTDALKNRIPGFSKDLPPALNVFGEEVSYKAGLGPDILSPIATSDAATDPSAAEIARLNIDLQLPAKTIGGGNGSPGIDLTPQQYHRLVKLMGAEVGDGGFKGAMRGLLADPAYQSLPEDPSNNTYMEAKEATIRKVFERYKRVAALKLLDEDPELMAKWQQDKRNAANALQGILQ